MRRMATGGSVNATVGQSVMEEQAAIYAQIQKSRRDSTAAPVPQANNSSTSSQGSVFTSQEPVQRAADSRNSQHEAPRTTIASASTSSSSNVPVRDLPSTRSSPEKFKPPPPTEARTSSVPVPPASATEAPFGSPGRSTASPVQERWMPTRSGASPTPTGAPIDGRRMPTAPAANVSSSSSRAPTSLVSPASANARHEPSRQATAPPVQDRTAPVTGPSPSHPHPPATASRTPGSLHRQTSQTWKQATASPIQKESYRPAVSSLSAKRSQSSFHSVSSNSGTKPEAWVAPELTDEPEEDFSAAAFGRAMPMPSARPRDPVMEKPIGKSVPQSSERRN